MAEETRRESRKILALIELLALETHSSNLKAKAEWTERPLVLQIGLFVENSCDLFNIFFRAYGAALVSKTVPISPDDINLPNNCILPIFIAFLFQVFVLPVCNCVSEFEKFFHNL